MKRTSSRPPTPTDKYFCLRGLLALVAIQFSACSEEATIGPEITDCSIPLERFTDGGVDRSGIPALRNPKVSLRATPELGYIFRSDLVIGLQFNDQPLAIPLKLLWWHEVVNFEVPGERLTVTYSPLTGSSLVFNPAPTGVGDFGVSKYVLDTNLVMEDAGGTLWPQMISAASCGPKDGLSLARVPYEQMSFAAWSAIHQDTWVVSMDTGFDYLYTLYPYGDYRELNNTKLRYPIASPIDQRRPPKERVIGVPAGTGGIAFPIPLLAQRAISDQGGGSVVFVWAASAMAGNTPVVAFWNSMAGAVVYRSAANGQPLTFEVVNGARRDIETGSRWNFAGRAVEGPLEGAQLAPMADAYHAFWFAWAAYQPDTKVWQPSGSVSVAADFDPLAPPTEPVDWSLATR